MWIKSMILDLSRYSYLCTCFSKDSNWKQIIPDRVSS